MARIPEEQIERLKQEISLQRLAEGMGITLKRHGADLLGLCPFHEDREPSLVISPKKNLWHCLGACQAGGTVIDWVMKAEGVSFRHAVELLQADYQPALAASGPVKHATVPKLPTPLESSAEDQRLLNQVIDYYHETLKQSPEALAYLEQRGIASREAIDRFKLGFANRTLGYRLPQKNRKEGAAIRGQLQRLGVLRASGHEHFNGSLVIPVIDVQGNVTEVYGRKLINNLRKGTPMHLYLPGPHQGVWNGEALQASKEVILCESLIDALTFWCAGLRNVTCSYGVEGFTADHLEAFKRHHTERVLIAYDRDAAGEAAAEKLAKQLLAEGIDCYRLHFPKGMDANEYALQVQPAAKSLGVVIRSANWLGKGKAKSITTPSISNEETDTPSLAAKEETASPLVAELEEVVTELEPEPLPASVLPDPPQVDVNAEVSDRDKSVGNRFAQPQAALQGVVQEEPHERVLAFGNRRYRVRGLAKNLSFDQLKVNVLVSAPAFDGHGEAVHVDTLDLYQARPRAAFIKQAAVELGAKETVIKVDLGKLLLKLEALQEEQIRAAQEPPSKHITLSDAETEAALALLKSPDLLERIRSDFNRCGLVGEETNKLVGYLSAVSRKLDAPLAVLIQSTSAAGKSSLMDAVLSLLPHEERIQYSAMTGQSLFYMGETDLKHKVLAIVEEEGASNAAYALKLLQSEGELTIASTGKDETTGTLVTKEYRVEGPVMIMLTTTAIDIDEELLNRCIVLTVDEGRAQTEAIHDQQRRKRTLEGLLAKSEKHALLQRHQNAQRLLQPLAVVNPYAHHLTFTSERTRTRRDHEKYLTLIDSIALLHQYQRPIKTVQRGESVIRYIEVTLDDIAMANRLAHDVLGRTLDELPPQTRRLLRLIVELVNAKTTELDMLRSDYRFSRRDVREHTQWGNTQLKLHLKRLEDLEYLLIHRGGRGQSFVYELLYDGAGEQEQRHLNGLIDVDQLQNHDYDDKQSGLNTNRSGSSRPQVAPKSGGRRGSKKCDTSNTHNDLAEPESEEAENALLSDKNNGASYRSDRPALVAKGAV